MIYMGIDHHNQYSHITIMDEVDEVIRLEKVANFLCFRFHFIDLVRICIRYPEMFALIESHDIDNL